MGETQTAPDPATSAAPPATPPGLLVTRMKDNQAALGVALHFLARRKPFGTFKAHQLVATVARQVDAKHYMMAFEGTRIVGFLGWDLYGTEAAERFARTLVPPKTEERGGEEVVWLMLAAATSRRALLAMLDAGRALYPGRRVMGVRHKPGGKPVIFSATIPRRRARG